MQNLLQRVRAALAERYDIASEAGRGAMAVVYRALDQRHDRTVAVKVLAPQLASAIGQERFLHEIRLAAGLAHPYVLPVLDSGEADGLLYYVMPFIEGTTLRERLTAEGELPIDEAVSITREMAEALEHAHAAGILHRDVKPSNILLTEKHALLADFGVARALDETGEERLTGTGVAVGSPAYMSPQQSDPDASPDARDDQYALACVLYEMLAGAPPFSASSRGALLRRHATDPVPSVRTVRPSVPKELEAVLERGLAKSAVDRFPDVGAFAEAALAAMDVPTGTGRGEGRAPGRSSGLRPSLRSMVTAMLVVGALAAAAVFATDEEPLPNSGFAVAPCQFSIPSDSAMALKVARALTERLNFLTPPPVVFNRMYDWRTANAPIQGPVHAARAREALQELGAQDWVNCALEDAGDEVLIKLTVFGRDGSMTPMRRMRTSREEIADEGMLPVAERMVQRLQTAMGRTLMPSESASRGTENSDAFDAFLGAEQALLDYDLVSADSLYGLAREYDPDYALATLRHSFVHRWQTVPESPDTQLDSTFAAAGDSLSRPDSMLWKAVITEPGSAAVREFRAVLEAYPDYPYGYLLYADEVFHRGSLGELGLRPDTARAHLGRALELNSRLGPAREHLTTILIMLGEKEEARESVHRLCDDFPNARWSVVIGPCEVWKLGWLERFAPDSAKARRRFLTDPDGPIENLMFAARLARYANLYHAQLELGNALVGRTARPDAAWHSGVNAVAVALSALGQPGASVQQFHRARDVGEPAALFADMWAVVPHALGLEGYPAAAATEAAPRLAAVVENVAADSMDRARAAWALALRAGSGEGAGEFERWRQAVERLAPDTAQAYRLGQHLEGLASARDGDHETALETTRPLLAYDSIGNIVRPFGRAVLYWQRGEWHEAAGDPDRALRAWLWHWNADIEGQPKREVQAAEIDGAFGAWAHVRSARIADSLRTQRTEYRERACREARGALDRWAPDPELFDPLPVEAAVEQLIDEMRTVAAANCRDTT